MHGWQNENKSRGRKAPLSVLYLFENVMTTKAAPAQLPPRGTVYICARGDGYEREKKNVIKM